MLLELLAELAGPVRCRACGHPGSALCPACAAALPSAPAAPLPPGIARLAAGAAYDGAARALVLDLKLAGRRPAAAALARLAAAAARRVPLRAEALAWVPGRRRDVARRGFDHAALLAAETARLLGLPARPLLVRLADTPDQTTLTRAGRLANLEGAFGARPCTGVVAVVDDLVTTGATGAAAAAALRGAGAGAVELLVACAAPPRANPDY